MVWLLSWSFIVMGVLISVLLLLSSCENFEVDNEN